MKMVFGFENWPLTFLDQESVIFWGPNAGLEYGKGGGGGVSLGLSALFHL